MAQQFLFSPIGLLRLTATETALTSVALARTLGRNQPNSVTEEAARQLTEYFAQKREEFTIALAPEGTEFRLRVWRELAKIPYGKTVTYGQLAAAIGQPKAARAVGTAVGRNPLLILLPCHRVLGAGSIGGFTGGLDIKRQLLTLEHIPF